jgi:hypothetical protein
MNAQFLSEASGKTSFMRVITTFIVIIVMGVFLAQNIMSMVGGGGLVSLGMTEASLLAGLLGVKAAQRFGESKATKVQSLPDTEMPKG